MWPFSLPCARASCTTPTPATLSCVLPRYEFGLYDTSWFTSHHDAIVVSVQYRIGPLGFLAHDALANEDAESHNGEGQSEER